MEKENLHPFTFESSLSTPEYENNLPPSQNAFIKKKKLIFCTKEYNQHCMFINVYLYSVLKKGTYFWCGKTLA